jgi:hypothetical protein
LFARNTFKAHVAGGLVLAVAGPIFVAIAYPALLVPTILIAIACIAVILWVAWRVWAGSGREALPFVGLFVSLWLGEMAIMSVYARALDDRAGLRDFATQAQELVGANGELIAYGEISSNFVHYYGRRVPVVETPEALQIHCARGDWIVIQGAESSQAYDGLGCQIVRIGPQRPQSNEETYGIMLHKIGESAEIPTSAGASSRL